MLFAIQIVAALNVLLFAATAIFMPFFGGKDGMPPVAITLLFQGVAVLPSLYVLSL